MFCIIGKIDNSQFTESEKSLFGLVLSKDKKSTEIIADQSSTQGEKYVYHVGADGNVTAVPSDIEQPKKNGNMGDVDDKEGKDNGDDENGDEEETGDLDNPEDFAYGDDDENYDEEEEQSVDENGNPVTSIDDAGVDTEDQPKDASGNNCIIVC